MQQKNPFRKSGAAKWMQAPQFGFRDIFALTNSGYGRCSASLKCVRMTAATDESRPNKSGVIIRSYGPGDLGWIVHRHGKLYSEEHGYNEQFEAVVAEIVAGFLRAHDPERERCWIAEIGGTKAGSIMLVRLSAEVAKLRLLLVEPEARGRGVGAALVRECVQFAREAGYRKITLWTHSNLSTARRLYQNAGFRLVHSEPAAEGFGRQLVDETWELEL